MNWGQITLNQEMNKRYMYLQSIKDCDFYTFIIRKPRDGAHPYSWKSGGEVFFKISWHLLINISFLNRRITELEEELGEVIIDRRNVLKFAENKRLKLREVGTPRPDWRRCGAVVEGGEERWTKLLGGKSSNQLMDILLDDITHLKSVRFDRDMYATGLLSI